MDKLIVTRILPVRDGIFVFVKPSLRWASEFKFLIQRNGRIRGQDHNGIWLEASPELSAYIRAKVSSILTSEPNRIVV